ncbi:MAG: hypothetical protein AB1824_01240 [Acidobacteriota bacterium]
MQTYHIGDRDFTLDELVLDQEEALAQILAPLYEEGEMTVKGLVDALVRKGLLRKALSVLLVPAGETVETANREDTERYIGPRMTLSQQARVIRDFFDVNAGAVNAIKGLATMAPGAEGSTI